MSASAGRECMLASSSHCARLVRLEHGAEVQRRLPAPLCASSGVRRPASACVPAAGPWARHGKWLRRPSTHHSSALVGSTRPARVWAKTDRANNREFMRETALDTS